MSARVVRVGFLIGFVSFLFLNTFAPGRDAPYTTHSFALLLVILGLALFVLLLRRGPIYHGAGDSLIVVYIALLPLMIMATVLHVEDLTEAAVRGGLNGVVFQVTFIVCLVLLRGAVASTRSDWLSGYAYIMGILAILASAVAVDLLLTGSSLGGPFRLHGSLHAGRFHAWFGSPNTFVNLAALGMLSAVFLAVRAGRHRPSIQVAWTMATVLLALCVVLSGSRGGTLAAFLGVVVGVGVAMSGARLRIMRFGRVPAGPILFGGVVVLVAAVGVWMFWSMLSSREGEALYWTASRVTSLDNAGPRGDFWRTTIGHLLHADLLRLLFGHGNGYTTIMLGGRSVHSGHIQTVVNQGLIVYVTSVVVYFAAMLRALRLGRSDRSAAFLVSSSLTFVFVRTFFNAGWISAQLVGFAFLALIYGVGFRDYDWRQEQVARTLSNGLAPRRIA